ncbi:MAG: hypothetical protein KBC16_01930 [Candidatus Pacebacteria bacterium]|nr:hypothetical protein [Candidatus Paceibacterota bacterium]
MSFFSKTWAPALILIVASLIAIGANAYEALYAGHVPVIETELEETTSDETDTDELLSEEVPEQDISE